MSLDIKPLLCVGFRYIFNLWFANSKTITTNSDTSAPLDASKVEELVEGGVGSSSSGAP